MWFAQILVFFMIVLLLSKYWVEYLPQTGRMTSVCTHTFAVVQQVGLAIA